VGRLEFSPAKVRDVTRNTSPSNALFFLVQAGQDITPLNLEFGRKPESTHLSLNPLSGESFDGGRNRSAAGCTDRKRALVKKEHQSIYTSFNYYSAPTVNTGGCGEGKVRRERGLKLPPSFFEGRRSVLFTRLTRERAFIQGPSSVRFARSAIILIASWEGRLRHPRTPFQACWPI